MKPTTNYFNELDAIVLAQNEHTVDDYITKVKELLERMRLEVFKEGVEKGRQELKSEMDEIKRKLIEQTPEAIYCLLEDNAKEIEQLKQKLAARDNKKTI